MRTVQRILAAIDLSAYSEATLARAADLARSMQASLLIGNIINARDLEIVKTVFRPVSEHYASPYSSIYVPVERYVEEIKQERRDKIRQLVDRVAAGDVFGKTIFKVGVPFEELIAMIKDNNIDLLVMGPKGRTDLPHTLFGTTAEKMFRHCPVPLLSIRTEDFPRIMERRTALSSRRIED